jgi:hypothetical protein
MINTAIFQGRLLLTHFSRGNNENIPKAHIKELKNKITVPTYFIRRRILKPIIIRIPRRRL